MNQLKKVSPDHPVHELVANRWSPYGFAEKPVTDGDLRLLFEAARWAASSYNEQPWRFLIATKAQPKAFQKMLSCLVEANQAWACAAPVLAIGCTQLNFSRNQKPNAAAIHDLGLASANLTFQATALGLCVHQMIGIYPDRVRTEYELPSEIQAVTGLAIGYAADREGLPEELRERDRAPRTRKPLAEIAFADEWGQPAFQ